MLVLTPYAEGVLCYSNMLYLSGAQYCLKVMLPLLLVWLLLEPNPAKPPRYAWGVLAVYLAGVMLTAVSSGIYVAAMGLAPVLLVFAWGWLRERCRLTLYTGLAAFGSVAATLAGLVTAHAQGVSMSGGKMVLAYRGDLPDNVQKCLVGIFNLLGAVEGEVSVTRLLGIQRLLCYGVCAAILLVLLRTVKRAAKACDAQTSRELYLAAPAVWNLALLCILNTRYVAGSFEARYHLIWVVPLLILLAVKVVQHIAAETARVKQFLKAACVTFMGLLLLLCDRTTTLACDPVLYGGDENGRIVALCSYLSQQDAGDVYIPMAYYAAEMGSALDQKHTYKTVGFPRDEWQLVTNDGSLASLDARTEHAPAWLVLREDTAFTDLPAYLQQAEYAAQVGNYTVYRLADGSVVDGVVGLPYHGGPGVDYPDSVGYNHEGQMDTDRSLTTDPAGGKVLQSPELTLTAAADITVNWESIAGQNAAGTVTLRRGGEVVAACPLQGGAATLENIPAGSGYELTVETTGGSIKIKSVLFTPK